MVNLLGGGREATTPNSCEPHGREIRDARGSTRKLRAGKSSADKPRTSTCIVEGARASGGGLQVEILHLQAPEPQQHPVWNWYLSCPRGLELRSKCQRARRRTCSLQVTVHSLQNSRAMQRRAWEACREESVLPEVMLQSAAEPGIDQGFLLCHYVIPRFFGLPFVPSCSPCRPRSELAFQINHLLCFAQTLLRSLLLSTLAPFGICLLLLLVCPSDCKFLDIRTSCNWNCAPKHF